jgi:recombinational DNA repair protein RecR
MAFKLTKAETVARDRLAADLRVAHEQVERTKQPHAFDQNGCFPICSAISRQRMGLNGKTSPRAATQNRRA